MSSKVIVITGASSGIGRLTAERLAGEGASLVLAARSTDALKEVASICEGKGAEVLVVTTDVSVQEDVDRLARKAVAFFGRIDVWINNAGVSLLSAFEDADIDQFRKVIETNFFGTVYGSRAALRRFKKQEAGHLINVSSVFGAAPSPYESPYVASKFAIRGLSGSLRQEVHLAGLHEVHVSTVLPSAIDTPIYRNAANTTGKAIKPPAPIYDTGEVADAIVNLIRRPEAEVVVGSAGRQLMLQQKIVPRRIFDRLFGRYIAATHFGKKPAARTEGNLFTPSAHTEVSGHWPRRTTKMMYGAIVAGGAAAGLWLAHKNKRRMQQ